jgi:hypothetical protein
MRKNFTLVIFLLAGLFTSKVIAQDLHFENDTIILAQLFHPDSAFYQVETHVINGTSGDIEGRWVREELSMPDGWTTSICDKNLCYLSWKDSANLNLVASESSIIDVRFYPAGNTGTGIVKVCYKDNANQAPSTCAVFILTLSTTSNDNISPAKIDPVIYPNPATDNISITQVEVVSRVELMNIVGKKIKTIETNGVTKMDISDLRSGMYLLNLIDENNKVIKTVRLLKE